MIASFLYQSGLTTLYGVLRDDQGRPFDATSGAFETYNASNYTSYAIALAEQGSTGYYSLAVPSAAASFASIDFRRRAGASAAPSDPQADSTVVQIGVSGGGSGPSAAEIVAEIDESSAQLALIVGSLSNFTVTLGSNGLTGVMKIYKPDMEQTAPNLLKTINMSRSSATNQVFNFAPDV
jgi:hypothetical protein